MTTDQHLGLRIQSPRSDVTRLSIHNVDRSNEKKRKLQEERAYSDDRKKAVVNDVYNSALWEEPRPHVEDRIRKIVRDHIFSRTKFYKGEGALIVRTTSGKRRKVSKKSLYGESHERMDVVTSTGYANKVMEMCEITADNYDLTERGLWWKVYCQTVKNEIMNMRGRKGYNSRELIQNSKIIVVCCNDFNCYLQLTQNFVVASSVLIEKPEQTWKISTGLKRLYGNGHSRFEDPNVLKARKEEYQKYVTQRRNSVLNLIRFCSEKGKNGLLSLRDQPDMPTLDTDSSDANDDIDQQVHRANQDAFDLFKTFVDVCMIHMTESTIWKYKAYTKNMSDIFTPSDEAMAMLFFENNLKDFHTMSIHKKTILRKESQPKYTKTVEGNRFQGWHISGIKRYNELLRRIKEKRKEEYSHKIERELKEYYKEFCNQSKISSDGLSPDDDGSFSDLNGDESEVDAIDDWDESN